MPGFNFTTRVRRALQNARVEASRLGHEFVGTEHILLGLLGDLDSIAVAALRSLSVDPILMKVNVESSLKPGSAGAQENRNLPYTSRAKRVLELAMTEARDLQQSYVSTEHLLLGLIREERGVAAQVLTDAGVTLDAARREVTRISRERGVEPTPPPDADPDVAPPIFADRLPGVTAWHSMTHQAGFVGLWWTLGLIVLYGSLVPFVRELLGAHNLPWHLAVLSGTQFIGAVLFLIPRTMRYGAKILLPLFVIIVGVHAARGDFPAHILVYAAATLFILVQQTRGVNVQVRKDPT